MSKLFGYSWIGWLNIVILQWFFVRLFYSENEQGNIENYGFIFPIVPLTGWWGDYFPHKYWNVKL
jgi:hypothetical protein